MTRETSKLWRQAKLATLLCTFLIIVPSLFGQQFNRVVIFGDSLSDAGNHFIFTHTALVPPYLDPVPAASYVVGDFHFSNGPTWAEQFTAALHLRNSGLPALLEPQYFNNYAMGRARARAGAPVFPFFDLGTQVGQFLKDGKTGSPTDLFVIWIGANDVADALEDPADAQTIIFTALNAEAVSIQRLYYAGARNFLVLSQPNLALTPFVSSLGSAAQAGAAQLDAVFNYYLDQTLNALSVLPDAKFIRLDTNAVLTAVIADPARYGLENVTNSCLRFGVIVGAECDEPESYLFWDGIHPTERGHHFLAEAALKTIGVTPRGDDESHVDERQRENFVESQR